MIREMIVTISVMISMSVLICNIVFKFIAPPRVNQPQPLPTEIRPKDVTVSRYTSSSYTSSSDIDIPTITRKQLASYSILENVNAENPTVRIPAVFKIFKERPLPVRLKQDKGLFFRDQNTFRFGRNTIDMIFKSIDTLCPSYNYKEVDVITDRNSLRNIYMFKFPSMSQYTKDFDEFYAVLVGNTVIFKRKGTVLSELWRSFGHSFESKFTVNESEDVANATGSWMINEMVIDGKRYIVRSEVDAVIGDCPESVYPSSSKKPGEGKDIDFANIDQYINIAGNEQKQYDICELKTRRCDLTLDIGANFMQMFFGNCSRLCVGFRDYGEIKRCSVLSEESVKMAINDNNDPKLPHLPSTGDIYRQLKELNDAIVVIKKQLSLNPLKVHLVDSNGVHCLEDLDIFLDEINIKKLM